MQHLWSKVTRRNTEEAPLPTCTGLAAAPVHEIEGPLLCYSINESPDEEDIVVETPRPRALSREEERLRTGEYQPMENPASEYQEIGLEASERATPRQLRWRRRFWLLGNYILAWATCCMWPVHAVHRRGSLTREKLVRFLRWEQWQLARFISQRRDRLMWIGWLSAMWGIMLTCLSTSLLVIWIVEEFGDLTPHPGNNWLSKLGALMMPFVVVLHLTMICNGLSLSRASTQAVGSTQQGRRRLSGSRSLRQRSRRALANRRPRLEGISEETERSSSSGQSMENVPLPETTARNEEQESGRTVEPTSERTSERSSEPPAEQNSQQELTQSSEQATDRDADVESSTSSETLNSGPALPKKLLRTWLWNSYFAYIAYMIGIILSFRKRFFIDGLCLVVATVVGVLPIMDVVSEYLRVSEESLRAVSERSSESDEITIQSYDAASPSHVGLPPTYEESCSLHADDSERTPLMLPVFRY